MTPFFPTTSLENGQLKVASDVDFNKLCDYGIFYLKTPQDIDITAGIKLAQSFYLNRTGGRDDAYRGFHSRDLHPSLLGYSNTGADQSELLQIEANLWHAHLPSDVAGMLWQFNAVGQGIIRSIMERAGVQPDHIDRITGGMQRNNALHYCIFNHYRSAVAQPYGLTPHKDSGFITILHSSEAGLDTLYGDDWLPVDPLEGHLTIVLGHSFEVLTERLARSVRASYHRVNANAPRKTIREERFSFGSYIGPRWDQDLYQYNETGKLEVFQSFLDFQKAKAQEMGYEFHPKIAAT